MGTAVADQQDLFTHLIKIGAKTEFGKEHHFSEIKNHNDYVKQVPLRDYEAFIPYIEKIKEFAAANSFKSLMTTYNNQPQYQSDKPAPVIRIETNCSLEEATKLGEKIQADIFKNNIETVYDIVP